MSPAAPSPSVRTGPRACAGSPARPAAPGPALRAAGATFGTRPSASTPVDARPARRRHRDAGPQVTVTGTPSRRRGGANDKEAA